MAYRYISFFLIIHWFITPLRAQVQKDSAAILQTDAYVKRIDSLAAIAKNSKHSPLTEDYSEGTITRQTEKTRKDSAAKGKTDTIIKTADLGRFSIRSLRKKDTILRIEYFDNTNKKIYESFYFKNRQMVFAALRLVDDSTDQTIVTRQEYYRKDGSIIADTPPEEIPKALQPRVAISLQEAGKRYYKQIMKGGL